MGWINYHRDYIMMKINKEPFPLFLIIAVIITREQTDLLIVFALFLFGERNYEKKKN